VGQPQALGICPIKPHNVAHARILGDAAAAAMHDRHMALGEWFLQQLPENLRSPRIASPAAQQQQAQQPQLQATAQGGPEGDDDDDEAFRFEAVLAIWQQRPPPLPPCVDELWDAVPGLPRTRLLPLRNLLEAAAGAAPDLATFARLHATLLDTPGLSLDHDDRAQVMGAAAACDASDWQARVEWLEARGYPRTSQACLDVVRVVPAEEGLTRLRWLVGRGYSMVSELPDC
jgi:hypothetical protein